MEQTKQPNVGIDRLLDILKATNKKYDIDKIQAAYEYAANLHEGQFRVSGEAYITHPVAVAEIVAGLELDTDSICAALLHDTVEDCGEMTNTREIAKRFGGDVALLVEGLTKIVTLQVEDKEEAQIENLRKMLLAMSKDVRVIFIKLCDRLHNMRTLGVKPDNKRRMTALETMHVYAPLAHRLGIQKIKQELENLAMQYLDPIGFAEVKEDIESKYGRSVGFIENIRSTVATRLRENDIRFTLEGRIKTAYSIYRKMFRQDKSFDEIYDFYAMRIIVDTELECYTVLGIIHEMFNSIPGRFKDYISTPKPNMYQSLHTTLIGPSGQPFEIQIRTYDMHRAAEYGIAAHWKYKEASDGKKVETKEEEKLVWLRQILEWQRDMSDNQEFMSLLKSDLNLFSEDVYCFTPNGEVKNLPAGSTPIDFAYSVHSEVGNKMIGAKVNGKLVPIDYKIQNGDRIEVITSQNSHGPSRDWLAIAKSTSTKNKINLWFRNELKEENISRGRELLIDYCKTKGIDLFEIGKPEYQEMIIRKYGFRNWEAVLAAVGHGGLKEGQVVNKLEELYDKDHKNKLTDEEVLAAVTASPAAPRVSGSSNAIVVKGVHDVAVRFSHCCNPVPGDDIVGFVTRGRGVSIHRRDCINVRNMPEEDRTRLIDARWEAGSEQLGGKYEADIKIFANNRTGILADISRILTENNVDIITMNTRTSKQGLATMETSFQVSSKDELHTLIDKIRQVDSVIDIERTTG